MDQHRIRLILILTFPIRNKDLHLRNVFYSFIVEPTKKNERRK